MTQSAITGTSVFSAKTLLSLHIQKTMQEALLEKYIKRFSNLRRDQKNGGAPHKPVLLLSILNAVKTGLITGNRIYVFAELEMRQ